MRRLSNGSNWLAAGAILLLSTAVEAAEQSVSTTVVIPQPKYAASKVMQLFFGSDYRDLWTTPIEVEVLDLKAFAGGLTPKRRGGGGGQTRSLRMRGGDGREYVFRSIDKNIEASLPPKLIDTVAETILQDATSSGYPLAPLVVDSLLEAAGVLHASPKLVVLPDDATLGEFREEFAGMLGFLEERPNEGTDPEDSFAGMWKVIGGERLFERINETLDDRVDSRAFLTARLFDIFIGDWDRHRDQWRWAASTKDPPRLWQPIPRDRDHAFDDLDGIFPWIAAYSYPQFVRFGPEYPRTARLHWNARELDRRFLSELSWSDWETEATVLVGRLSNEAIDAAVRRLPPEHYEVGGEELTSILEHRRNGLIDEARELFELSTREVEIYGTDEPEDVLIEELDENRLLIELRRQGSTTELHYRRVFDRHETKEIRVHLLGGDDQVSVRSTARLPITVRVIGGSGDDLYADSTEVRGLRLYDQSGTEQLPKGSDVRIDRRPYEEWSYREGNNTPPVDWGRWWRPVPWISAGPDLGLFLGGGFTRYRYGFRRHPYSSRMTFRGGYSTAAKTGRVDFAGVFHLENAKPRWEMYALVSGIETLNYFGEGNDTQRQGDSDFHRVKQGQIRLEPLLVLPQAHGLEISLGPIFQFSDTKANEGRFISTQGDLYGLGDFSLFGIQTGLRWNSRDRSTAATRGVLATLDGRLYPKILDVEETFGDLRAELATYLTPSWASRLTFAVRAGGQKIWGRFPYFSSAFVGGWSTLRGWDSNRFAGDTSLYGSAELRLFLREFFLLLPGDFGIFAIADSGRVWVERSSPGGWHNGIGGGLWFAYLERRNTVTISAVNGREGTAIYISAGFGF